MLAPRFGCFQPLPRAMQANGSRRHLVRPCNSRRYRPTDTADTNFMENPTLPNSRGPASKAPLLLEGGLGSCPKRQPRRGVIGNALAASALVRRTQKKPAHASLLIQPLVQAMCLGNTVDEVAAGVLYIHPALTEVIEQALLKL